MNSILQLLNEIISRFKPDALPVEKHCLAINVLHSGKYYISLDPGENAILLVGSNPQTLGLIADSVVTTTQEALFTLLADPESLWEFVFHSEFACTQPIAAARVFEIFFPGIIGEILLKKLKKSNTEALDTNTFFDAFLPARISGPGFMSKIKATYNFEIEDAGTWGLSTHNKPVLTNTPLPHAKCTIKATRQTFNTFLAQPETVISLLVKGQITVTNPCRARQLFMALWREEVKQALPPAVYHDIFSDSSCEYNADGEVFHTYVSYGPGNTQKIFFTDYNGVAIVEGDIEIGLTKDLVALAEKIDNHGHVGVEGIRIIDWGDPTKYLWPDRTLHYVIASDLKDKGRVADAIAYFKSTNVIFSDAASVNYVEIINADSCSSRVGMGGGKQTLKISEGCGAGNLAHELCHALGLYHEQARYDRDTYVTIETNNIESGKENNFEKQLPSTNAYSTLPDVRRYIAMPPTSPADGDRYLISTNPTSAWAGKQNQIAQWAAATAAWSFTTPQTNNLVRVVDEDRAYAYNGTYWIITTTESKDLGAYDYGSIMHYSSRAFGKKENTSKKKITIKTDHSIGQRDKLSSGDVSALNTLYPI